MIAKSPYNFPIIKKEDETQILIPDEPIIVSKMALELTAKNALTEIKAEIISEPDKEDLKWQIKSFDFQDRKFPSCNQLYVVITQDMLHDLANSLDSLDEIAAMTSTFNHGEISLTHKEIRQAVIRALLKVVRE